MKDSLGDRMKFFENFETGRIAMPGLPIMIRLDGKNFSKFTKGLERPYDKRLSDLMIETTKFLVKETNANCAYTQSDEITLVIYTDRESQPYFGGRFFKITSTLASRASVYFNRLLPEYLPEKVDQMPTFDCRVWQVPSLMEAVNAFIWRENDATKNSITMAARCFYSYAELLNVNGGVKQEILFKKGINWNDYPAFFRRGSYIQRKVVNKKMTVDELETLPEKHLARQNPDMVIERSVISVVDMPVLSTVTNRVDVIIYGKEPETKEVNSSILAGGLLNGQYK